MAHVDTPDSSSMNDLICSVPSEQLRPTLSSEGMWETETQNAYGVWPERVLPLMSTTVPEIITGRRCPVSSKHCWIAYRAALQFSVSNTVSTSRMSTPPSVRPSACSR